jgi:DNA repair photolyase
MSQFPTQLELFKNTAGQIPYVAGRTVVREVVCKTILNKGNERDYSLNCYTGCAHGCVYCYARFMERFHPHDEPWGRFVDVKINALSALSKDIRRSSPGSVFVSSACDGWQPLEKKYELTRNCCKELLRAGFKLIVLTKSPLILRDMDLFYRKNVQIGVTITTADEQQARLWEPYAGSVTERINVLKEAKAAKLHTAIMFSPILPGISDNMEALVSLFELARKVQVDTIWTDCLNCRPRVWESLQRFLIKNSPALLEKYRDILFDPEKRSCYRQELSRRIWQAACSTNMKHALAGTS